tara:strand:+ start:10785 stop:10955 length:171 start_codon:yes stop_codon:yes gene_type:complete
MIVTEEQKILGELYNLEESLSDILISQEMYEEIRTLHLIIEKLEYRIINKIGTIGI